MYIPLLISCIYLSLHLIYNPPSMYISLTSHFYLPLHLIYIPPPISHISPLPSHIYPLGWRHQFVAGTLHSAVISRDEHKIRDLLSRDDSAIDTIDDDGYSALHYACMYRCTNAVRLLRGAGDGYYPYTLTPLPLISYLITPILALPLYPTSFTLTHSLITPILALPLPLTRTQTLFLTSFPLTPFPLLEHYPYTLTSLPPNPLL